MAEPTNHVHGRMGVFLGGDWVPMEEAPAVWNHDIEDIGGTCADARRDALAEDEYDVVVVGAGCVGCSVARELSRFCLKVLVLEKADDVTQGATKGNSGIVHAGYDDKPGSVRAKFCPKGCRMFPELDRDLKFGFQRNGSLVVARAPGDEAILADLLERGKKNGVQGLRILDQAELRRVEPLINPEATSALFAPHAGIVIPFEFTIALAENAARNGVEFRTRRAVTAIERIQNGNDDGDDDEAAATIDGNGPVRLEQLQQQNGRRQDDMAYRITAERWRLPQPFSFSSSSPLLLGGGAVALVAIVGAFVAQLVVGGKGVGAGGGVFGWGGGWLEVAAAALLGIALLLVFFFAAYKSARANNSNVATTKEVFKARYVVNAAGLFSDKVARMVGDDSFSIKPRIGEYLLGKRPDNTPKEPPPLCRHIVFPCPGKMGKGILVQPTLWGNLCLGPTAHDFEDTEWRSSAFDEARRGATKRGIKDEILRECRKLFPGPEVCDEGQVIHSFAGVRAKNSTGDWIVRCAEGQPPGRFVHAAGIDSPGLAGSPAVALEVVRLLKAEGALDLVRNPHFNPKRRPYIIPKGNWKMAHPDYGTQKGKTVTIKKDHEDPARNVVCRCELVTEAEIVDSITRGNNDNKARHSCPGSGIGLPVDTTQAVRKRTRAGMGWCQGEYCQPRVQAILARELRKPQSAVPARAWPESSLLDDQHQYAKNK